MQATLKLLRSVGIGVLASALIIAVVIRYVTRPIDMPHAPLSTSVARRAPVASPPQTPTKEFTFVAQGGQRIVATTAPINDSSKRVVVFTPFLEKTDGNLYLAALESLRNLYGKERGAFYLQDAQMRPEPSLGGQAICWRVSNPAADYCVFPTKDTGSERIGALTVWTQ